MLTRRSLFGTLLAAPAIIRTPGLLMLVKPVLILPPRWALILSPFRLEANNAPPNSYKLVIIPEHPIPLRLYYQAIYIPGEKERGSIPKENYERIARHCLDNDRTRPFSDFVWPWPADERGIA